MCQEWHELSVQKKWSTQFVATVLALIACFMLSGRSAQGEQGRELVFGMSAAFTGATGELGMEYYRGLMAYVDHFNAQGGANGWTIKIIPANDGYNPAPCFKNTVRFVQQEDVFALCSYVGTPTTTHILPLLQKFESKNIYLLFPFTGAQPLRTNPYGKYVYNLRASYFDETAGLVNNLVRIGRTRIGVFYQSDAYGRTGWDGVRRALKRHGLRVAASAAYRRGASFDQDFSEEVGILMAADVDAIIVIGTYASQGAFVRDARDAGFEAPIAGLSFADSDKMLELVMEAGVENDRDYTRGLINSQVVPSYSDLRYPGVRLYRDIMDNYKGIPVARNGAYKPRRFSYVSFEGFLNGILLGEMIKRMADNPSRERIPEILESLRGFDLGIGQNVDFGGGRNQGLDAVFFTRVINGEFRAFSDWERWEK